MGPSKGGYWKVLDTE